MFISLSQTLTSFGRTIDEHTRVVSCSVVRIKYLSAVATDDTFHTAFTFILQGKKEFKKVIKKVEQKQGN